MTAQQENQLLMHAYSLEGIEQDWEKVMNMIKDELPKDVTARTIDYREPADLLKIWDEDFRSTEKFDLTNLLQKIRSQSTNFRSKGYVAHQVAISLPVTILTSAFMSYLNNLTTVYEVGMVGNALEKIVINELCAKFGYAEGSTGVVASGGSLGNLTALVHARTTTGIPDSEYHRLCVLVSEEAHYSVSRGAIIMGIRNENIISIPCNQDGTMKTELLESIYQDAVSKQKIVFCVVGCACSTSVGAYDDLKAIGEFAHKHQIWFHVDGAHGAPAIFSDKYRHYLSGIEHSDSLICDFHKMMLTPALSTAVLYNRRYKKVNEQTPHADYLWQDELADEWYHSAKHTLECSKPLTIIHTYVILRMYGEEIYKQNVDTLYGLGHLFAEKIKQRQSVELALEPLTNIVCFRYHPKNGNIDAINQVIADKLLKDGTFYIVNTRVRDQFYLRVTFMNPLTDAETLDRILDKVEEFGLEAENNQK